MKNSSSGQFIGIPVNSISFEAEELPSCVLEPDSPYLQLKQRRKEDSATDWMSKFGSYVHGLRDHVSLGPKISETVKGKLSLGARILQAGGIESVFRQAFSVGKGEKLVKALQCYLSTSAGPIAGMIFISTEEIAFLSDRPVKLVSPQGKLVRIPYKVLIPLRRIKRVIPSENSSKPNQKYINIVTVDEFEFWFMGFVSHQQFFKYLQQAISEPQNYPETP